MSACIVCTHACMCMQVQSLEVQLEQSSVKQELQVLQRQLELLEVERKEDAARFEESERKNRELEEQSRRGIAHTHKHCKPRSGRCSFRLLPLEHKTRLQHSNKESWPLIG